jgi:hypothetical protein
VHLSREKHFGTAIGIGDGVGGQARNTGEEARAEVVRRPLPLQLGLGMELFK